MSKKRTFWYLESLGRKPSEYDIATSRLLYHVNRGFEVKTPFSDWYEKYGRLSPLALRDWERFRDPRETTYTRYVELQKTRETFEQELLNSADETQHDAGLSDAWLRVLERVVPVLRFPVHGLQMVAAYVGQMAPASRLVITCSLQAADEMRRIQRFAYRMRQLEERVPGFGAESRATWERDGAWQPLRRAIEKLLVTYDWGEAFTALNLCLKPAFDELFMTHFATCARQLGDHVLAELLHSLAADGHWHRQWSGAFVAAALAEGPENLASFRRWIAAWDPVAKDALYALSPIFEEAPLSKRFDELAFRINAEIRQTRAQWGLVEAES